MDKSKLIERLEKLLNMGSSSNANEAAIALEKATKLMEESGLSKRDVDASKIIEAEIKSTQSVSKPKDWEVSFIQIVARAFGCKVLWRPGNSKRVDYWGRYILVGHTSQVPLAEYTASVLLRELVKARSKFSAALSDQGHSRGKEMTAKLDGFCKGWISAMHAKVLAFANSKEVEDLINEKMKEMSKGKPPKIDDRGNSVDAFKTGIKSAANFEIHRPMTEDKVARIGVQ